METVAKSNMILLAGELTTHATINIDQIVRDRIKEIGYDNAAKHHKSCCPGKTSASLEKTPSNEVKIKKLTSDEVNILKSEGNEITYITGKITTLIINIDY